MWNKPLLNETRLGLQENYAHLASVHVIGEISRRRPSELIIFKGLNDVF
jgi:hypothetical protein